MRRLAQRRSKRRRRIVAAGLVALLAGCSSIPDAVNSAEWYKGARDLVFGKDGQPGPPVPGAGQPIPDLNTVPERPKARSREQRGQARGDPVNPPRRSPRTETPPRAAVPSPRSRPPAAAAPAPRPALKPAPTPPPQVVQAPPAATAATPAPAPAPRQASPTPQAPGGGEFETIVISSAGVQTAGGASASPPAVRGSYQVATILFDNGSSRLNARDRRILRQVFAQQRQTGGTVRIIGHASRRIGDMDLVRHKLANFRVSAARADAVARELVRIGARPGSLSVRAVSSRYPRYHEYMPSGEAGNRRAEIFIDF